MGIICSELEIFAKTFNRSSGTATTPTFGSIVQKGKLAAVAFALATKALNNVDLPTLGSPTIPALSMGSMVKLNVQ